jgi:uncharacterized protein (DUF2252 family)
MRRAESFMVKNKVGGVSPDARASALSKTRNAKMARSPHAYVRRNTIAITNGSQSGTLPEGPAIWICGDCDIGWDWSATPSDKSSFRFAISMRRS